MDQRQVFEDEKELLALVTSIFSEQQKASLLIDRYGLTRVEGMITSLDQHTDAKNSVIIIDNAERISLKDIVGINGLFRQDYTEC
jgi:hypothetical protein